MSIASEITRLQGAKADLATAIEGKGVTVPSATKLDGYADLVDAISQGGGGGTMQSKSVSYTPSTSAQSQTVTADVGYDGLSSVAVSVAAMPSGTEGTPTATKGTVSNNSVTVTPSVTNSAGYIEGGTKTGTAVTVSASELVAGYQIKTANGTYDVTNLASLIVQVPNSYSASDEGKVVSNGALVAQTAHADVTPTTSDQTIDTTTNNSIKVKGDADLIAGNIKKDVDIFGVTGTYEGSGGIGVDWDDIAQRTYTGLSIVLPTATKILSNAFNDVGIVSIEGPEVTELEGNAVAYNSSLTHIRFPKLQKVVNYSFARNTSSNIEPIVLPRLLANGTNTYVFERVRATLDFTDMSAMSANFLRNWYGNTLILRKTDDVCSISGLNVFQASPFASDGSGGTLYVPQSLIASYQAASNWSTILGYTNNSIKSIESTHTDPDAPIDLTLYYADGTLIPT